LLSVPLPQWLKVGTVEPEEMVFVRQQLRKYSTAAMNTLNNMELLDAVCSVWSMPYQLTQYVVKGTWVSGSSQNFMLNKYALFQ
jgi:spore coat protein CotF